MEVVKDGQEVTEAKKNGKRGARQKPLPGMQPEHPDLDELAADYADARDQRMRVGQHEVTLKQQLLALMHEKKLEHYRTADGLAVVVEHQEKDVVKVKRAADVEDEPEGGE